MLKKQHTDADDVSALKQYEGRDETADICRNLGVSVRADVYCCRGRPGLRARDLKKFEAIRELLFAD